MPQTKDSVNRKRDDKIDSKNSQKKIKSTKQSEKSSDLDRSISLASTSPKYSDVLGHSVEDTTEFKIPVSA
jgi:hypothetical protein